MFKKLSSIFFIVFLSFNSIFAYTPTDKDKQTIDSFNLVIKQVFTEKLEEIKGRLEVIKPQFENQAHKIAYLLDEIEKGINNVLIEKGEINLEKVIDGDTIKVKQNGEAFKVRFIGIDSPEKSKTRYGYSEKYGDTATDKLKSLLDGKKIMLEYDETQGKLDKYNRHLAYVFADGININLEMIKLGLAKEYTYNKVYKYQKEFKNAEKEAKANKFYIWEEDYKAKIIKEKNKEKTKEDTGFDKINGKCAIKGNINSKKEKIYHYPGCQSYNRTKINLDKGERMFCTTEEAEKAGWRVAGNCN